MPKTTVNCKRFESFMPSLSKLPTNGDSCFVLDGENFIFDSKGPKAFFASRLLNAGGVVDSSDVGGDVQSIGGFIFTTTKVGRFDQEGNFITQYTYADPIIGSDVNRSWTRAFVSGISYFCHPGVGILKYNGVAWSVITTGVPGVPQAVAESNGRLGIMTTTVLAWSGPESPEDFTPELGGSGFQAISTYAAGSPLVFVQMPQGFLTWTTLGGMISEFIGGDAVYRHYPLQHSFIPISDSAIARLPDGSYVFCTPQGLHSQSTSAAPSKATPIFNEFLRDVLKKVPLNGLRVRLDYSDLEDLLFVQIRDWSQNFTSTYVLSVALDQWGVFSEKHLGIIHHGVATEPVHHELGYVDVRGIPHRFMPYDSKKEVTPGVFEGLGSWVELGPIRDKRLEETGDSLQEVQQITLGVRGRPRWSVALEEIEDRNTSDESDENYNTSTEDDENLSDSHLLVDDTTFGLTLISDLGGFDEESVNDPYADNELVQVTEPELIRDTANSKHYACLGNGLWHRLRLEATEVGEYFHVTSAKISISYYGKLNT